MQQNDSDDTNWRKILHDAGIDKMT